MAPKSFLRASEESRSSWGRRAGKGCRCFACAKEKETDSDFKLFAYSCSTHLGDGDVRAETEHRPVWVKISQIVHWPDGPSFVVVWFTFFAEERMKIKRKPHAINVFPYSFMWTKTRQQKRIVKTSSWLQTKYDDPQTNDKHEKIKQAEPKSEADYSLQIVRSFSFLFWFWTHSSRKRCRTLVKKWLHSVRKLLVNFTLWSSQSFNGFLIFKIVNEQELLFIITMWTSFRSWSVGKASAHHSRAASLAVQPSCVNNSLEACGPRGDGNFSKWLKDPSLVRKLLVVHEPTASNAASSSHTRSLLRLRSVHGSHLVCQTLLFNCLITSLYFLEKPVD